MQPKDWLLVGALLALAAWALWDRWMQAKEMARLRGELDALGARQDRLQGVVEGKREDWRDSLDLTSWNWRRPPPF